jgi:hypothetical protein
MILSLEQVAELVRSRRPQFQVKYHRAGHPCLSEPTMMVVIDTPHRVRALIYHDDMIRFTLELIHMKGQLWPMSVWNPDQEEPGFSTWLLELLDADLDEIRADQR